MTKEKRRKGETKELQNYIENKTLSNN